MLKSLRRLFALFRRNRLDEELAEEIQQHLELRRQSLVEDGRTPAEADREARLQFGIGASTLLFSFANTLLFRPIQASNPKELLEVFTSDFDGPLYGGSSYADY